MRLLIFYNIAKRQKFAVSYSRSFCSSLISSDNNCLIFFFLASIKYSSIQRDIHSFFLEPDNLCTFLQLDLIERHRIGKTLRSNAGSFDAIDTIPAGNPAERKPPGKTLPAPRSATEQTLLLKTGVNNHCSYSFSRP